MTPVISVEKISKFYRLGIINTGTFADDLKIWWARTRGKPNPLLRIGQADNTHLIGKEIWALRDINFKVERGEALGIIGRNGAGKSTLLKILSRVTAPTSGEIKVKGRIASLLEVGTGFHPDLTGRENIYLNGAILGMTKEEVNRKMDEIVDFSGVGPFIETPVKRYSSGMYVRLAFAVAAHLDPEILLLDEVLAVGDIEFQKKCLGKMGEVAREGRTVLFVSHNMASIINLCPRSILVESGEVVDDGDSSEIVSRYLANNVVENQFQLSNAIRTGDYRVRVCDFKVNPQNPRTGAPVEFTTVIEGSENELKPLMCELAVSIRSQQDTPLLQFRSGDMGKRFLVEAGARRKITVSVPVLPLVPGKYRIHLWLGRPKITFDSIKESFTLNVFSGSFAEDDLQMGRTYPVVIPSNWSDELSE
jgi:lipopolysaccharide transport system ATP-binding protein